MALPFTWFVALRYLTVDRAQTGLVLAAVSVGVSVIVFLSALIGGLQTSLIDKTLGSQPHITLRLPREKPRALVAPTETRAIARRFQATSRRIRSIDQWPEVMASAERTAGVIAASPLVEGAGFALRGSAREPIFVRGVDAERFLTILDLRRKLVDGRFDIATGNVAIGATLADNLGVGVGDRLRISTTEGIDDVVTVNGVFRVGNEAVDRTWVLTSLRHAQALYALPGGVNAIELKVADIFAADDIARDLHDRNGLDAASWMKLNAELLSGLSAQSSSKSLIEFFVTLAVALGIASVLSVSVVQKSREIGILRAVGTPARRVLGVFLLQGGLLGLSGSLLGSGLGAVFAKLFERLAVDTDGAPRFPIQLGLPLFAGATAIA
ncbi:MAG: FtsX-like permease family protein, partial [Haliangium ochraceum]